MFKKIDFEEEILKIKAKGVTSFMGHQSRKIITVTFNNNEKSDYYIPNTSEYSKFNHKLRKIYQEE